MAVSNSIAPQQQAVKPLDENRVAEFKVGDELIKLSPAIVRNYLVRGRANLVTDGEIALYINLCKYRHLNPWTNECYLIKYSEKSPATMVVSKDAKLKRAKAAPEYAGHEAGVIVVGQNGELQQFFAANSSWAAGQRYTSAATRCRLKSGHPSRSIISSPIRNGTAARQP